jgi:2-phospho-L-lactate guanylyltransferase
VPTVVVIPVRSFRLGKTRLAEKVEDAERIALGRALAFRVAEAAENVGLLPLVVTADPEVAAWATSAGFPSLPEPGEGLNLAVAAGVEWAASSRSSWIVLHADLPLVEAADILRLAECLDSGLNPIAPSSDGGTSAIGGWGAFAFSFGIGSFHRHLARLATPRVVTSPGLLLDLDSPADLAAALAHPRGRWLREVLG